MAKPEEKKLEQLLENKFYCSRRFAEEIEKLVKESRDLSYIDAIVLFCENNSIEVDSVSKLISKPLKEKIRCEATELNLLKRTSHAKLPL